MCCQMTWLTPLTLVLTLPVALSDLKTVTVTVTGTAGQNITLHTGVTGLHGDYQVIWSRGSGQELLLDFDSGKLKAKSENFHLDARTGALTIHSLSVSDSGLYRGQIINGNGSLHYFNLTVVEPDPPPPPTGPPEHIIGGQRSHLAAVVPFCIFAVVLLLACGVTVILRRKPPG